MRVRDMRLYWCELCWACVILFGLMWLAVTALALILLFAGIWVGVMWVGGFSLVFGGVFFWVAYSEARSHWKRSVK